MAVTVSNVVDAVLAAVECDAGVELVATWVGERYRELTNRTRCRHLLRHADIVVPAAIDDGLVTVTPGSDTFVGDATAQAAWSALGTDALVDRHIRIANERHWYRITGLDGSGNLLTESPFTPMPTTPTAPAAYLLVKRYVELAEDVRHVAVVTHPRLYRPLNECSHQELDLAVAGRVLVADVPIMWAETEPTDAGRKRIEVYPFMRSDQILTYSYYAVPDTIALATPLPQGIDLHVLKAGALVDVYRWEMAKALRANKPDVAATWRNEMNTASTRWEEKIREAIKAERVSEVAQFSLQTGFPTDGDRMIRDARDFVWAKGNRP